MTHPFARNFFSRCLCFVTLALALAACQTTGKLNQQQITALIDAGFLETDVGWELTIDSRLLFDTASAALNQKEKDALDKIAQTFLAIGITNIIVEGHTDSTGTESYNKNLSQKRAKMVADYLVLKGMPENQMEIKGFGSDNPVASNLTAEGRRENRRTVIIVPSK